MLVGGLTHNAAYMIRDASTSLLPTMRCWMSGEVRPFVMVLLVPHIKTKWTRAMRASSGMILNAMILSSLNNFSVLTYRPDMRTMIIANAKPVHHHESRSVGLSAIASLAGGGVEYQSRGRSIVKSHQLLHSSERKGRNACSLSTKACPRYHSILFPLAQNDVSLGHIVDSFYLRFGSASPVGDASLQTRMW